jgi:3-hydroxyacyl-CoA dehydrogenase/enoyl-CoA hydratase/3-hydroxybutyryl-CoA epimerase
MRRSDSMQKSFSVEKTPTGVALITFDIPGEPVNTLSEEVRAEFEALLEGLSADSTIKAAALLSGKPDTFIAGAKIEVLQSMKTAAEAERLSRSGQAAFDRLEHLRMPVVAAIHGACLGGGLELALACTYRLASDARKTSLGFPEVQLGVLPGGGGTQRAPRLLGVQAALDLILTGKQVKAQKALKLGLVDEVCPAALLRSVAEQRALELAGGKRPDRGGVGLARLKGKKPATLLQSLLGPKVWTEAALEENPVGRAVLFRKAKEALLEKTGGHYPAPLKALEAVRAGVEEGLDAGYRAEARGFGELVVSDVSRQLVHLFFAQTALKKDTGVDAKDVQPRDVEKIGMLGAGLMGSGIAYVSMNAGIDVRLKDRDLPSVQRGMQATKGIIDERVKRKSLTRYEAENVLSRLSATADWSGFKTCDLFIEAVFEDLKVKHQVLAEVEALCKPEAIFASNTSSLPISRIAEASKRPENVVGMHYFSPVHKMPLLEVIATKKTSPQTVATAVAVGKKQGKTVIVVNDGVGFYTSRILTPYLNEAAHLLVDGADALEVDEALREFGFPVGPITLLDEVGLDVGAKVAHIMQEEFGERMAAPRALEQLVHDGRLGRKAKKGLYRYDPKTGKKLKEIDETLYERMPGGKTRKSADCRELAERVALQMVNEAVRCLGDGILRSARDGDVGAVFGLGFPPFRGGPFRYLDNEGAANVLHRLEGYLARFGARFTPAPLLVEYAKAGKKFYA